MGLKIVASKRYLPKVKMREKLKIRMITTNRKKTMMMMMVITMTMMMTI